MKRLIILVILLIGAEASAGGFDTVIVPPAGPSQSGRTTEFTLYLLNAGGSPFSVILPARLTCRIAADDRIAEASAGATDRNGDEAVSLAAGSFVQRRYAFTVPEDLKGPARLFVREFATDGALFSVAAPESPEPVPPSGPPSHPAAPADTVGPPTLAAAVEAAAPSKPEPSAARPVGFETLDALLTSHQPYLLNFSAYEPMYFLVGTDPKKSKFQISFKYRLLNPKGPLVKEHPWLGGLHLGYTQTSFWDLESDSAPFEDTSYKPELFFISFNLKNRPSWLHGLFFQTGFKHESNGRGGLESRSANFFYAKPVFIFYSPKSRYGMAIAPKIWTYIREDRDDNPALSAYRGYFELELKLGKEDGFILGSCFRWASAGASVQLDLTYPLRSLLFGNIDLYLHAQYVNALAESLLNFRERSEAVRLGFSIVR